MSPPARLQITSAHNPRIKEAAALRERKERQRQGLLLVEGARELSRAVDAGWTIDALFVCDALASAATKDLLARVSPARGIVDVSPHVFDKLAMREGSDGVAAVLVARTLSLEHALAAPPGLAPLVVALHGIEKPGNLGAVLRTADGTGATGVVVLEGSSDPFSPNAIRASLGTVFSHPLAHAPSDALIAAARARDIALVAAALTPDACPPWQLDLTRPTCLVLGAEATGLPDTWLGAADRRVAIPMRGAADSYNVSVAGAMLLYDALRQRSTR